MPEIAPFRGIRYNGEAVDLESVVAPPYDVISPELQSRLYERNPHNVVRLILGRESDRYASAAEFFKQWQKDGILRRDDPPALYVLHQIFEGPEGTTVTRKGFIALCRLVEFDKQIVLPHEKTMSKPREDRLRLFKAAKANFSQIFCLYSDPEQTISRILNGAAGEEPAIDVTFEGVQNKVWPVTDPRAISQVKNAMHAKQILIADGHHRYETALTYRDFMRSGSPGRKGDEPYEFVMMFLTNVDDPGLVIYPTHRVIHSLGSFKPEAFLERVEEHFIVREFADRDALRAALDSSSGPTFGTYLSEREAGFLLSLKPVLPAEEIVKDPLPPQVKELDVTILHRVLLQDYLGISPEAQEAKLNIEYVRDASEAIQLVSDGKAQLAFLMNATKIQQVRAVAKAGHTMPQKSTYFYPKLLSGLVINSLEGW